MALTILVADDDSDIVELLANLLEGEGHRVLRAYDGAEALVLLTQSRPDLLVTDNMMPQRTGLELIAYLHDHPDIHTTVILMSAITPVPIPPATAFLPKPFDLDALLNLIAAHFATG